MYPLSRYVAECLAQGLLTESPIQGVYWTPSIARKVGAAGGGPAPLLDCGDFFVGTYDVLQNAKATAHALTPGILAGSEIHHIVEFHLQFLGVVEAVNDYTYKHEEPCVLLAREDHKLRMENAIGWAERVVLESKPFDFVEVFKAANPGLSNLSRTEAGRRRAAWVKSLESAHPPTITRHQIRDWLLEMYQFAYQEADMRPLRLISTAVLRGMSL